MKIQLEHDRQAYQTDLSKAIDISIPAGQVRCFYATEYQAQPLTASDFVGAVKEGSPVNFFDVQLNPHGNGTHTECLGHITEEQESLLEKLKQFHFTACLVSVPVSKLDNGDEIISKESLLQACPSKLPEAFILRTFPNSSEKLQKDYSGTNPPYLTAEAMQYLVKNGVKHLLLDLPSVDREDDGGKLVCHRLFWDLRDKNAKKSTRSDCTITELIFVPNEVEDGLYLLNIQVPSLHLDAAPSKPVIYKLERI